MCYVDESGDTGSLDPTERNSQPIFLISAVIVRQSALKQLTRSIIELKKRFFPSYGNLKVSPLSVFGPKPSNGKE